MLNGNGFSTLSIYLLVVFGLLASSCNPGSRQRLDPSDSQTSETDLTSTNPGGGKNALPGEGGITQDPEELPPKVEIRHLIEPKLSDDDGGGAYVRKLTLPKNYSGFFYLAGINVSTLTERNVWVRFKFGRQEGIIEVPATVSTAPGIIPTTSVQVLVMDFSARQFEDIRLLYDLYDYNEYDFMGSTSASALSDPIIDPFDDKLFCRGLNLENDPTFEGNISTGCTTSDDTCKYAYAKVLDSGLIDVSTLSPVYPTEMAIDLEDDGDYYANSDENQLKKCMPDEDVTVTNLTFNSTPMNFINYDLTDLINISGTDYVYYGPFNPVNVSEWQVSSDALDAGGSPLFTGYGVTAPTTNIQTIYGSYKFPRWWKTDLAAGIGYLGSSNPEDPKTLTSNSISGETSWMDGCNGRASTYNDFTGEHIGSCNVTSTIEVYSKNDDGTETVIDITNEVKLQLTKPSLFNSEQENVLFSSFKACSSNNACASDECCYNSRCWSKDLVSQCIDDENPNEQLPVGQNCQSDLQCSSLCCSSTSGTCQVHNTTLDPEVTCSKLQGQACIADEWCRKEQVRECLIVLTGYAADNVTPTCELRCYNYQENGLCKNGFCTPPTQPTVPTFNPDDPNRCANAIPLDQVDDVLNSD
ncbi:hypothetical protein N9N67_10705 [Bacteriovoracaceae bacterium]|nr:hypothetical protein [Bacteriovoracaceae bacterium]